jgi:hypothetical protein
MMGVNLKSLSGFLLNIVVVWHILPRVSPFFILLQINIIEHEWNCDTCGYVCPCQDDRSFSETLLVSRYRDIIETQGTFVRDIIETQGTFTSGYHWNTGDLHSSRPSGVYPFSMTHKILIFGLSSPFLDSSVAQLPSRSCPRPRVSSLYLSGP